MKTWHNWLLAITVATTLCACGGGHDDPPPPGNIVQVAQANGFTALAAAATKAGLLPTLSDSAASLTVFAPTDAAFNTLATRLGFANATALVNALPATALASISSIASGRGGRPGGRARRPPSSPPVVRRSLRRTALEARLRRWR